MKKFFYTANILGVLVLGAFALSSCGSDGGEPAPVDAKANIPTTGLSGFFRFNGDATDASDNKLTTTVTGATLTTDAKGKSNRAYQFNNPAANGPTQYIEINDNDAIDFAKEFTVSFWYYNTNASFDGVIIDKRVEPDGGKRTAETQVGSSGMAIASFQRQMQFIDPNGRVITFSDEAKIDINTWYHVTITYQASNDDLGYIAKLYFNGSLKDTFDNLPKRESAVQKGSHTYPNTNAKLRIGANNYSSANTSFNGKLDEVAIYKRAITAAEVKTIYDETNK